MPDPLDRQDDPLQIRIDRMVMRVLRLHGALPKRADSKAVATRVLKSATFTAVGYRAASRARTNERMVSHLHGTIDRIDELRHWLKFMIDCEIIVPARRLDDLRNEVAGIYDELQEKLKSVQPEEE
jgi:four helix bundle protein